MIVAELIEELRKLPQHHPVYGDVELRYDQPVFSVSTAQGDSRTGPYVVIRTASDPRNDPEPEIHYEGEYE